MKTAVASFWLARAPRERRVIAIGAALLAAAIVYAYLWLPIAQQRARLMAELPRLRVEAQQMRAEAREISAARSQAKPPPADLKAVLASFTAAPRFAGLSPQLAAEANGRVRVSFASVRPDAWFAWLAALALEEGVRVDSAQIEVLDAADAIRASATLAAGAR